MWAQNDLRRNDLLNTPGSCTDQQRKKSEIQEKDMTFQEPEQFDATKVQGFSGKSNDF